MSLLDRMIAATSVVASLEVDVDCHILEANPAFSRHSGVGMNELRGRSLMDFVAVHERDRLASWCRPDADLPATMEPVSFVGSSGSPFTLLCLVERKSKDLWIVGEIEVNPEATLGLIELNQELATLSRENSRRRRELEQTQNELAATLHELRSSYWHLQKIQEVLPLCMGCNRVKTEAARWDTVVDYLKSNALFLSHGYCPPCEAQALLELGLSES